MMTNLISLSKHAPKYKLAGNPFVSMLPIHSFSLHGIMNEEQYEKHLYNQSSQGRLAGF